MGRDGREDERERNMKGKERAKESEQRQRNKERKKGINSSGRLGGVPGLSVKTCRRRHSSLLKSMHVWH